MLILFNRLAHSQFRLPDSGRYPSEALKMLMQETVTEEIKTFTPLGAGLSTHATDYTDRTHIMSILNTTPDSFSDGGVNSPLDLAVLRETAGLHIRAGATIIDIGGQSSRPNAPDVTAEEEIARILPAIAAIKALPESENVAISVDTYRADVAEAAAATGAHIINDISAGALDPRMYEVVAKSQCTYIMMHMRGTPSTMTSEASCTYPNLLSDIRKELQEKVEAAVHAGVRRWRIVLDPGIGFAKNQQQNLVLLRRGTQWRQPHFPYLIGPSRKGFIGNITGVEKPAERIWGTAAAVTAAIRAGANIVRVHDVKEMAQVVKMAEAIYKPAQKARAGADTTKKTKPEA